MKKKLVAGLLACNLIMVIPQSALATLYSLDGNLPKASTIGTPVNLQFGVKDGDAFLKNQTFEVVYEHSDRTERQTVSNNFADELSIPIKSDKQEPVVVSVIWKDPDGNQKKWVGVCNFLPVGASTDSGPGDEGYIERLTAEQALVKAMKNSSITVSPITQTPLTQPTLFETRITSADTPNSMDLSLPNQFKDSVDVQAKSLTEVENTDYTFKAKIKSASLENVEGLLLDTGGSGVFNYKVGDEIQVQIDGVTAQASVTEVGSTTLKLKLDKPYDLKTESSITVTSVAENQKPGMYTASIQYIQNGSVTNFSRSPNIMITQKVTSLAGVEEVLNASHRGSWLAFISGLITTSVFLILWILRRRKK